MTPESEAKILNSILIGWGAHPMLRIARVNVGVGWFAKGKPARKGDPGAYPVKFGVPGQADITGLMLPSGRRLEIECKSAAGVQSDEQIAWQRMIVNFGGVYILARSLADVDRVLIPLVGPRHSR